MARTKLSELELSEMAAKYRSGATLTDLSSTFGVSVGTVANKLKKTGVEMRPRGRRKQSQ